MYNSKILHECVMREYEKLNTQKKKQKQQILDEIYTKLPAVKDIDDAIAMLAVKNASRIIKENITPDEAVEATENEKLVLLEKRNNIIEASGLDFPKYSPYFCALCHDTGFVNGKKCRCYMDILQKVMKSGLNGSSHISLDLEKDTFDRFELKWYDKKVDSKIGISPYENMKSLLNECKLFCFNFDANGGNLYFYGNSGTGKTFMASCIANELIKLGKSVMYQSAYKLFQLMEDYKFGKVSREEYAEEYDSVYNSDLLIIDDLGTEFTTTYTCSVFFDILNTRLLNKKSTVISTNLSVNNLSEKYTERISSRIIGDFEMMRFIGEDIRITKKFDGR